MLEKVTANNVDSKYLNIADLEEKAQAIKIAYVIDVKSGYSKIGSSFYTLYVKDVEGNRIPARIFSPENFIESGFDFLALKGKLAKLNFMVDIYNGSLTLNIISIEPYDDLESKQIFIGKVENSEQMLKDLSNELSNAVGKELNLSPMFNLASFPTIFSGRAGGYTKFLTMWYDAIESYLTLPNINKQELLIIFYKLTNIYYIYLERLSALELVTVKERIDILKKITTVGNAQVDIILQDICSALFGLGEPEHLYSHILYFNAKTVLQCIDNVESWALMPLGSKKIGECSTLVKY